MNSESTKLESVAWRGGVDGHLRLIDQTKLPLELVYIDCESVESVGEAIKMLRVRGAPAIGMAAAFAVCIGLQDLAADDEHALFEHLKAVVDELASSRPTAVNLFWALDRMQQRAETLRGSSLAEIRTQLLNEAAQIRAEDRQVCHAIGRCGADLLADGSGVLTHCNAGGLATSEYGTALSVFLTAQDQGKNLHVFVDETRPLLQGSRLTTWELMQRGIPATLICDSMAAQVMREQRIQAVVTGADRIAANGDAANKIGTYSVAVLARAHNIPFYVAAPRNTFDLSLNSGDDIPIEHRPDHEITHGLGRQIAPDGINVYNPAFDVTPAHLITAIITEVGLIQPVTNDEVGRVIQGKTPIQQGR